MDTHEISISQVIQISPMKASRKLVMVFFEDKWGMSMTHEQLSASHIREGDIVEYTRSPYAANPRVISSSAKNFPPQLGVHHA